MGDDIEMMNSVKLLGEHYPTSVWRLKALVTAGNRYVATNDKERYAPLFKAASDTFPADNSTAYMPLEDHLGRLSGRQARARGSAPRADRALPFRLARQHCALFPRPRRGEAG